MEYTKYLYHNYVYYSSIGLLAMHIFIDIIYPLTNKDNPTNRDNSKNKNNVRRLETKNYLEIIDFIVIVFIIAFFILGVIELQNIKAISILSDFSLSILFVGLILNPVVILQYKLIHTEKDNYSHIYSIFAALITLLNKGLIDKIFQFYTDISHNYKFILLFIIYSFYYSIIVFSLGYIFGFYFDRVKTKIFNKLEWMQKSLNNIFNTEDDKWFFNNDAIIGETITITVINYLKELPNKIKLIIEYSSYFILKYILMNIYIIILFIKKLFINNKAVDSIGTIKSIAYFSVIVSMTISYLILLKLEILNGFEKETMNLIITATLIPYIISRYFEGVSKS